MATITKSHAFGERDITLETGRMAKLADGAVVVTYGETQVLATCVSSNPREGIDFFPLTIDVEERMYAVGKIPGSFFRREGRPSETAVLTCRLIDRPLRPTFQRATSRHGDRDPSATGRRPPNCRHALSGCRSGTSAPTRSWVRS